MVASRNRPEGGLRTPFGLGVLILLLQTSEVGYQDLAALIARQPPVVERLQKAAFASPFGTIHEAKFSIPRPIGAAIPPTLGYALVGLDPSKADITGSIRERILGEGVLPFGPMIDRSRKGDYGVMRKSDRAVALKGDRLKPVVEAEAVPTKQRPDAGQRIVVQRDGEPQPGQPLSPAPPIGVAQADGQTAAEPVPAPAAEHQPAQRQATEQHVTEQQVAEVPRAAAG